MLINLLAFNVLLCCAQNPKPSVVPELRKWNGNDGNFAFSATRVFVNQLTWREGLEPSPINEE